jgi:predicted transcriptional regulator
MRIAFAIQFILENSTIPPIRVAPAFRGEIESVLEQGESLSEFVENAVRQSVLKRQNQTEFVRRGMAAIEETQRLVNGIAADDVLAQLDAKLAAARKTLAQRKA